MKKTLQLFLVLIVFANSLFAQVAIINDFITEGIKLHDKGDYKGAIDLYKKALVINPRSDYANYELASTYMAVKDYGNAIKHSDKVIAAGAGYLDQAYILKASALDLSGKPIEAIKTYKKALQKFTGNHLLYYNLALTSFKLKAYKDVEDALQKAIKINPHHASSHLLLGNSMIVQDKRVKGILALYNFLLLEPKGNRTMAALQALEDQYKKGIKKIPDEDDEFYTAELMLTTLESAKTNEANKNRSWHELFAEKTNNLFEILGDMKKDQQGFWWNFYVDYFSTLATNHHTEAFSYYITQSKDDMYTGWMQANLTKMETFSEWYTKYLHKF